MSNCPALIKSIHYCNYPAPFMRGFSPPPTLEPGQCLVEVDARPELLQHYGYFHGGVSAYLIDNASAIAAATIAPGVSRPVTSEFKVNFLAPTKGAKLSCHARVVKSGRTLVIVAADIHAQTDDHNTHVATALATVFMT